MKAITPYVLAAALLAPVLPAVAQEAPAPAPKQIVVRPGLTITDESAFAVYVKSTTVNEKGQFAGVEVYVITDDGPQRLTLCDDLVVPCNPITVRAEGVNQGDGGALVWE